MFVFAKLRVGRRVNVYLKSYVYLGFVNCRASFINNEEKARGGGGAVCVS